MAVIKMSYLIGESVFAEVTLLVEATPILPVVLNRRVAIRIIVVVLSVRANY